MAAEIDYGIFQDGYTFLMAASAALAAVTGIVAFLGIYPKADSRKLVQPIVSGLSLIALITILLVLQRDPARVLTLLDNVLCALGVGAVSLVLFLALRPILSGTYDARGGGETVVIRVPVKFDVVQKNQDEDGTKERKILFGGSDIRQIWPFWARALAHVVLFTLWLLTHLGLVVGLLLASMLLANPYVFSQENEAGTVQLDRIPIQFVFETESSELPQPAPETLRERVREIASFAPAALVVRGHADSDGADAYNDELTQKRANAVLLWLKGQPELDGIDMRAVGMGERCPFVPEDGLKGANLDRAQAHNRRVELVMVKDLTLADRAVTTCDLSEIDADG